MYEGMCAPHFAQCRDGEQGDVGLEVGQKAEHRMAFFARVADLCVRALDPRLGDALAPPGPT